MQLKKYVVEKDVSNAKIKRIENKIPDITYLATNTALNSKIKIKTKLSLKTKYLTL